MEDTLLSQRQYFDNRLAELSQIKDLKVRCQHEVNLVFDEEMAEFSYRSGLTRGKIIGLGLEKFMPDIIDGMNQSSSRVLTSDLTSWTSTKQYQEIFRVDSDALLRFALGYVDRWVMYNNLFNEKE